MQNILFLDIETNPKSKSVDYGAVFNGQESRSFCGSNGLRPDVILRKGGKTYIIDTKWKRPNKSSASFNDLRQVYTYYRFWDAEKALLLYPGESNQNKFKSYLTDDYSLNTVDNVMEMDHQCKMGYVSVLKEGELNPNLGEEILKMVLKS